MWSVSVWVLTVNAARPPAYLFELSQPWRCWSPSCEVVSETLSLTHIIGQCFISHIHPTRAYTHTLIHTLTHTHTHAHKLEISQITLPTSCVLIFLLLFSALQNSSSMFILVLTAFCTNSFQADSLKDAGLWGFLSWGVFKWLMFTGVTKNHECLHKGNGFRLLVWLLQSFLSSGC